MERARKLPGAEVGRALRALGRHDSWPGIVRTPVCFSLSEILLLDPNRYETLHYFDANNKINSGDLRWLPHFPVGGEFARSRYADRLDLLSAHHKSGNYGGRGAQLSYYLSGILLPNALCAHPDKLLPPQG